MIVGVLTTCHTQYTYDSSICIFYLIEQHSKFLLHTLQVLYMCTLCDSTNINTIIEFVPDCLQHVSGDGFSGGSDSYLQFRDTHAPCLLKLCIPPSNGIVIVSRIWCGIAAGQLYPTISLNNPVFIAQIAEVSKFANFEHFIIQLMHHKQNVDTIKIIKYLKVLQHVSNHRGSIIREPCIVFEYKLQE